MHELAFGIVICFGSSEFLHIYATLHIDASLHSLADYMHQHLPPLSSLLFAPVDLQAFPTVESFLPPLVPPAVSKPRPRPLEPALSGPAGGRLLDAA